MNFDPTVYLAIAEIAGVFVGFGALIGVAGFSGAKHLDYLGPVVTNGLLVIFAALLPVGLNFYSIPLEWLWRGCAAALLLTMWTAAAVGISNKKMYERTKHHARRSPSFAAILLVLEVLVQLPLLLCAVGLWSGLAEAFYMTSILVNLLQASFFMVKLVLDGLDDVS